MCVFVCVCVICVCVNRFNQRVTHAARDKLIAQEKTSSGGGSSIKSVGFLASTFNHGGGEEEGEEEGVTEEEKNSKKKKKKKKKVKEGGMTMRKTRSAGDTLLLPKYRHRRSNSDRQEKRGKTKSDEGTLALAAVLEKHARRGQ